MAHLLLIEDDKTLRRALRVRLEKMGHIVIETAMGGKVWRRSRRTWPIWLSPISSCPGRKELRPSVN